MLHWITMKYAVSYMKMPNVGESATSRMFSDLPVSTENKTNKQKNNAPGGFSQKHGVRGCSEVLRCIFINSVYQWGGFEIVWPLISVMVWRWAVLLMKMIIMGHHFSKNGIEMGWFSHTSEVLQWSGVFLCLFVCLFFSQYTGIEMVNILKSTLSIPV